MRHLIYAIALLSMAAPAPTAAQQPTAIPVTTVAAELQPVTRAVDFVGRVEAIGRVEIRARVTGYLEEVAFKEGDVVKEGDVLYRIERDSFQAALQQAQGAVLQAQGNLVNATAQLGRTQELVKTDTESRALLDQRIAAQKSAQGSLIIADSNLKTANVNLGYTEITSPITGEIGRTNVTKGNVVSPDSGPLTVVVSRDPIYVTFPVSQRVFLDIQGQEARHERKQSLTVRIGFANGTIYPQAGRIDFIDVQVDRSTDTVLVRASVPNPSGTLIAGQLVRVSVEGDKPEEKVVIPQTALIADQQGPYIFLVIDGKAAVRRIKIGGELGANVTIDDGLKGGEQVVVQGMESLKPGSPVLASPAPAAQNKS